MMNRRSFIQFLGAFAAGSALPLPLAAEKIARAPAWVTQVLLFRCAPLQAGHYTFSAFTKLGLYVTGVDAMGGETIVEIPMVRELLNLSDPRIIENGIMADTYMRMVQLERGKRVMEKAA
jgi:hypothetical protein